MKTKNTLVYRVYGFITTLIVAALIVACAGVQPAPDQETVTETLAARPPTQAPSQGGETTGEWNLAKAAEPYRGVTITASFLPRPGYEAVISLIPEFEKLTGITVKWESIYYEQMRNALVLDFTSDTPKFDIVLIDVVWTGEFASAGWITPLAPFYNDPALADPNLDLDDFFPILLESFGAWDKKIYGLPFDNYSGLLYYNKCMLKDAGFDRPPDTWQELKDIYGPALTKGNQYAFALQSARARPNLLILLCALSGLSAVRC